MTAPIIPARVTKVEPCPIHGAGARGYDVTADGRTVVCVHCLFSSPKVREMFDLAEKIVALTNQQNDQPPAPSEPATESAKLDALPVAFQERAVSILRDWLKKYEDIGASKLIRAAYERDPKEWWAGELDPNHEGASIPNPFHLRQGMAARNALREAGLIDDQLPSGNWDDYYIPLLEIAAGCQRNVHASPAPAIAPERERLWREYVRHVEAPSACDCEMCRKNRHDLLAALGRKPDGTWPEEL